MLLSSIFPAMPNITFGPEFELPPYAGLADVYRALRRELEDHFSLKRFEADLDAFNGLTLQEQTEEILNAMVHFSDLGQAVTIVIGHGLYEDQGDLKPWVSPLLGGAASKPGLKLCLVSNRQLRSGDLRLQKGVQQIYIGPLDDADTRALILATVPIFGGQPQLPAETTVRAIGGHPTVARAVARLLATRGPLVVDGDPRQLFDIQEQVLAESLSFETLTPGRT